MEDILGRFEIAIYEFLWQKISFTRKNVLWCNIPYVALIARHQYLEISTSGRIDDWLKYFRLIIETGNKSENFCFII